MSRLDDKTLITRLDKNDMYHKIIHLPEQIQQAYFNSTVHLPLSCEKKINRVIISGMGGSAISGDLIQAALQNDLEVIVCKDYQLPPLNANDLFIACSYSGNTEETVSCLKIALEKRVSIAAVTTNGQVKSIIDGKAVWIELPTGYPPRSAIGYLFFSIVKILEYYQLIPQQEDIVTKVISTLMLKAGAISCNVPYDRNIAKQSAEHILGKIPIIYSSNPQLAPVAYRWKCQINENSKYPAFFHSFPEMNHNEIEAWEHSEFKTLFIPIFLSNFNEDIKYQKRISFMKQLFSNKGIKYLELFAEDGSYFEKAFSLIYLGDMISFYLALLQDKDPTSIDYIEQLKKDIS